MHEEFGLALHQGAGDLELMAIDQLFEQSLPNRGVRLFVRPCFEVDTNLAPQFNQ